jgi:hypothetical protein
MRKLVASGAVALAVTLATAGIVSAASPVKGSKYFGTVTGTAFLKVTFKVSKSGTKVTALKVTPSLPNSCGYGGPLPKASTKSAKIKHGRFTAKITEKNSSGIVIDTAKVRGKFLAGGKEKGTIKTDVPKGESCSGSFAYTTTAQTTP